MRCVRRPLLHFIAAGLVLVALQEVRARISSTVEGTKHAESDTFYRAAVMLGIDRGAAPVRERLDQLGRFLDLEGEPGHGARDVGLVQSDPVIRRHIEQLADLALHQGGAATLPDESEVAAYYRNHVDDLVEPPRVSLSQIYFSYARHGDAADDAARSVLAHLRKDHIDPAQTGDLGDAFHHDLGAGSSGPAELRRVFGPAMADAIETAPVGSWVGPLASAYGAHLLWISQRTAPRRQPLAAVRNRIVHRLKREREGVLAAQRLAYVRRAAAEDSP